MGIKKDFKRFFSEVNKKLIETNPWTSIPPFNKVKEPVGPPHIEFLPQTCITKFKVFNENMLVAEFSFTNFTYDDVVNMGSGYSNDSRIRLEYESYIKYE